METSNFSLVLFVFIFVLLAYVLFRREIKRMFWRIWYRHSYLKSGHWQHFRQTALAANGWECQAKGCHSRNRLNVHHLSYEHLGSESLNEVTVLCQFHHSKWHKHGDVQLKKMYD